MELITKIESILFIAGRPLSVVALSKIIEIEKEKIKEIIPELREKFSGNNSGIILVENGEEMQLVSNPLSSKYTAEFLKEEIAGPLTRPQLEAVTIIAYCGPVTKLAIEQIRGVNCSLILRNLLLRGLIEEKEDKKYSVTIDFLRYLGLASVDKLPDYDKLKNHDSIKALMNYEQQ